MDIRELRYFNAVYQERNLTAAARKCFISQPSVSGAISNLEAELQATLFIRHKKGVAPTSAADDLYAVTRRIVDDVDAARTLFRKPVPKQALTIGLMRTLDIPRTMKLLAPLTGNADIHLRLVDAKAAADARIVSKSMVKSRENFVPLWTDRYVAALPPKHPLTLKDRLRASDLAGLAMIDRCHCEQSRFYARLAKAPTTAAIAETEEWAMALVAAGVGIAIAPDGVVRNHADVAMREIVDVDLTRQVGIAFGESRSPSRVLQDFIASVRVSSREQSRASSRGRATPPARRGKSSRPPHRE